MLLQFQVATHGMITNQRGERKFDASTRPFKKLPQPIPVENPIDALHALWRNVVEDHFAGRPPSLRDVK